VKVGIAAALLVGLPSVLVGGPSSVGAVTPNLPVFPNNIMVFPNRDFVSLEGFSEHAGEAGLVRVTRPGVGVVGSAIGIVSGTDVAFEVNHPGGICWGAGTGLQVTPDIQAGDVVSLSFGGVEAAATTSLDVYANDAVQNGTTVIVTGHIGNSVDPANMEQRIIEPALVDTVIGKRDVRAVPGPLTPAPRGGYQSSLEFAPATQSFTATYIFDNASDAFIAANAGLGERAMAWEFTDAAGNRQGMTIAENGEPGGPGVGGCPNGPLQSGPPGPTSVVAVAVPGGIKVNWTPVVALPGTQPILGYRVTAISPMVNTEQVEVGRRITNPGANSTTITGLVAGGTYDINVASFSSVGETFPPVTAIPATDVTPPTVAASPAGGSYPVAQQVTLTANELGSQIFYTTDTSDPVTGPELSINHYTGPITIDADKTLKFVAFDPSNNVSSVVTEDYAITNNPVPAATSFTNSSVGQGSVTLTWAPAAPGAPGLLITSYEVDVFGSASAVSPIRTQTTNGDVTTATISGLTGDTPYWFTVSARNSINSAYGPASALLGPLTPQGTVVANAGPDQTGVVRNTPVTLSGAGSTAGATYAWSQLITAPQTNLDRVVLSPVAGQPQNARFTLPLYSFPMVNSPLTFQLTVTVGAVVRTDTVVITPRSDVVTITSAKWKPGDFRVVGTSTTVGGAVTIRSASGTVYGFAPITAAAPPAVGGVFDFRLRAGVPTTKPATVFVDSNLGGTAGPFNVAG
jgi:hypothetical protein